MTVDYYWCRVPGRFVEKTTGVPYETQFSFTGTTREWYETLVETMIDVSLTTQQEITGLMPLRYVSWVCDPNVAIILECSVLFRPLEHHKEIGTIFRKTDGILQVDCEKQGVLYNLPVRDEPVMKGSMRADLYQFYGTEHERIIGSVTVVGG